MHAGSYEDWANHQIGVLTAELKHLRGTPKAKAPEDPLLAAALQRDPQNPVLRAAQQLGLPAMESLHSPMRGDGDGVSIVVGGGWMNRMAELVFFLHNSFKHNGVNLHS